MQNPENKERTIDGSQRSDLSLLKMGFKWKVIDKLLEYRNRYTNHHISAIDYLASQHYDNKSLKRLSEETRIDYDSIRRIFEVYCLPPYQRDKSPKHPINFSIRRKRIYFLTRKRQKQ
ncbi:MAG: hypothetical protein Q8P57_05225 [Candidatus Pacearchaeota archaeon]|nr:hypothetical protein [Candidatus Pacearchaeota archaeon]